jgi:hypothetical protein
MKPEKGKIWIGKDPKLCEAVQKKLFGMGYSWSGGGRIVDHIHATALFLRDEKILFSNGDKRNFDTQYSEYSVILTSDLLIETKPPIDLENKKIWIGGDPKLSAMVQEKAFELGWRWISGHNTPLHTGTVFLIFNDKTISFGTGHRSIFENDQSETEIFPRDLGIVVENPHQPHDEEKIKVDLKELLGQIKGL